MGSFKLGRGHTVTTRKCRNERSYWCVSTTEIFLKAFILPIPCDSQCITLTVNVAYLQAGKPGEVVAVLKDAIDVGFRHIDGAMYYENEAEVGAAIREKTAEGVIKRDDLFVTSKVGLEWSFGNILKSLKAKTRLNNI